MVVGFHGKKKEPKTHPAFAQVSSTTLLNKEMVE